MQMVKPVEGYDSRQDTFGGFSAHRTCESWGDPTLGEILIGNSVAAGYEDDANPDRMDLPDIQRLEADLRRLLEPLDAWDPETFGLWVHQSAG